MENIADIIAAQMEADEASPFGSKPQERPQAPSAGTLPIVNTQLRACNASACANWNNGACSLEQIEINEHGGCGLYEASSDESQDTGARYETESEGDSDHTLIAQIAAYVPNNPGMPFGYQG